MLETSSNSNSTNIRELYLTFKSICSLWAVWAVAGSPIIFGAKSRATFRVHFISYFQLYFQLDFQICLHFNAFCILNVISDSIRLKECVWSVHLNLYVQLNCSQCYFQSRSQSHFQLNFLSYFERGVECESNSFYISI